MDIGDWDWDWELRIGMWIRTGDYGLGLGSKIGIKDLGWGFRFAIGNGE